MQNTESARFVATVTIQTARGPMVQSMHFVSLDRSDANEIRTMEQFADGRDTKGRGARGRDTVNGRSIDVAAREDHDRLIRDCEQYGIEPLEVPRHDHADMGSFLRAIGHVWKRNTYETTAA